MKRKIYLLFHERVSKWLRFEIVHPDKKVLTLDPWSQMKLGPLILSTLVSEYLKESNG